MKKEPRPVTFLEQREAPDHAQRRAITINSKRHVGARTPVIHQKASCTAAAAPHVVMEPLIFMKGVGDLFKVSWGYFARFLGGELGRGARAASEGRAHDDLSARRRVKGRETRLILTFPLSSGSR